ncbi:MAG: FAD-binding protein [Elusimicrobia bacterium GWA2_69_24]|nr:MAG: FAD-binding protein [Elusimicrobia bacterium GWA2_69_24]HBL16122.1 FAD-binding protein [Elusimicrobiota bacterium]
MPIAQEFELYRPKTLDEAGEVLKAHKSKARVLAGGTDLLNWLKEGLVAPEALVDIKGIPELRELRLEGKTLSIGAAVTFAEILESELVRRKFPLLWEASRTVASGGVRSRATLVGNICSAIPSLDSGPALLVHEARARVQSGRERRMVPLASWFLGPRQTALAEGEFVTGIELDVPDHKNAGAYLKLGRYAGEDLAQVGLGVLTDAAKAWRVAFCAVGPVPARAPKIEALLAGKALTDALLRKAQSLVAEEIRPITDIRSSKEYRLHMAEVMLERGLRTAASRLAGRGPEYGVSVL